ncbi:MAG: hypothetical protein LBL46_01265 [Rickettsiales bacterium]|jgi:hypothetical protein|nr:hypothetical protein [Rickettsiales bacterium]
MKALILFLAFISQAAAVQIVANVNGMPITDADITERTKIMPASLNNRAAALVEITDDIIKIEYARQWKIEPTDGEIGEALARAKKSGDQARLAARAEIAWNMVIGRTIMPSIVIDEKDIAQGLADLERERGLPLDITFIRLVDVPAASYDKLTAPKDCAEAVKMAKGLGGAPQKMTIVQYEMAPEIRDKMAGLAPFVWSPLDGGRAYLICEKKKTAEWGKLDDIIKQNAAYKRALFQADQILKQLRRKAAVVGTK